jgi:hypothetical protein
MPLSNHSPLILDQIVGYQGNFEGRISLDLLALEQVIELRVEHRLHVELAVRKNQAEIQAKPQL